MTDVVSPSKAPETIGRLIVNDLLSRRDFMMYDVDDVHCVHYAEACAGFGALRFAGFLNDDALIGKIRDRYARVLDGHIVNTANHVDANVYGILPLELYTLTGEDRFLRQGMELADGQWRDPLPNGMTRQTRYWIDDVYMIASLQVRAYEAVNDPVHLDRAGLEIESYLEKLQRPNGLFFHGNDAKVFWGRGNGWVAAGLAELLTNLPESNSHYSAVYRGFRKMMGSLKALQCSDGMWRQLLDREEAWKETSSTAMFGFAAATGVKAGLLPENDFTDVYERAWAALVERMTPDGRLTDICAGTGQSADITYYLERPRVTGDLHGQAAMLWLAYSSSRELRADLNWRR